MTTTKPKPTDHPDERYILPHCPACGRPFGKRPSITVAKWFTWGTPQPSDLVHWGCRFARQPKAARTSRPLAGTSE